MSEYIVKCVHCGRNVNTNQPCIGEKVICLDCADELTRIALSGIKGYEAGIALRIDAFYHQMDKIFIRIEYEKMLDKILKQAIKEDDSRKWYQKLADYIKKNINILIS